MIAPFSSLSTSDLKSERDRLNKDLFHLSSQRLRHTSASKPWTSSLLQQVHDRSIQFIEHLRSEKRARSPHQGPFSFEFAEATAHLCIEAMDEFFTSAGS